MVSSQREEQVMRPLSISRLVARLTNVPEWFQSYISQLNDVLKDLNNGLNKDLTLEENISCQEVVMLRFVTASDYTSGTFTPLLIPKTIRRRAKHVLITQLYLTNNPGATVGTATNAVTCTDWYDNGTSIVLKMITGLDDSQDYTLNILIF